MILKSNCIKVSEEKHEINFIKVYTLRSEIFSTCMHLMAKNKKKKFTHFFYC